MGLRHTLRGLLYVSLASCISMLGWAQNSSAISSPMMSKPIIPAQIDTQKQRQAQQPSPSCVILLHGLMRSSASMNKLESHLSREGYYVVNQDYQSRSAPIEQLAIPTLNVALSQCPDDSPQIHVVTHSLGGILLRYYLETTDIERLGRSVMLGPPNKGSQIPDKLGQLPGFEFINGQAGQQLGTDPNSIPQKLGPANFDVGIIAGSKSINLFLSQFIPDKDDGKVAVENTKLVGMRDHITLPVSHPFLMLNGDVLKQVSHYLSYGSFDHRKDVKQPRSPP